MFGLGMTELLIVLAIVLVVFGAGRLPRVMGELGKGINQFKQSLNGTEEGPGASPEVVEEDKPIKPKAKPAAKKKPAGKASGKSQSTAKKRKPAAKKK